MVHHPLVVLPLFRLADCQQLEDGEEMHSQVEHEVDFEFVPHGRRPVRVLLVDASTTTLTPSTSGKPILGGEDGVADDSRGRVEDGVVAELQEHFDLPQLFLSLVFGVEDLLNQVPHEFVV